MKLFVISIAAIRETWGDYTVNHVPMMVIAHSEEEAFGKGMQAILERCPFRDGWKEHQANVLEMPNTTIEQVADN